LKIPPTLVLAVAMGALAAAGTPSPGQRAEAPQMKAAPAAGLELARFLPEAGAVKGWNAAGAPQTYKGEDLFLYIDGGAEIYHEYGFRQVLAQEYRSGSGQTLSLEIYEMADAAAAYGMFTFKSSAKGSPAGVGQDGRLEDYYLNFWKGPCLVTITAFEESAECRAGLLPLARAVEARMALGGERPPIMRAVPEEWKGSGRAVYLEGFIGLNNVRILYPSDIFLFREGLAVEQLGFTVFLFSFPGAAEAGKRFEAIRKSFGSSPLYNNVSAIRSGGFDAILAKGGRLAARLIGARIGVALTAPDAPAGTDPAALLARIK
jgi:hypothetical protein